MQPTDQGNPSANAMSMPDWLGRRARLSPHKPALICGTRRFSFAELDARASHTARCLRTLDVNPRDRVALLLQNGPAYAELLHALPRLGAILVPLNTRLTPDELAWQLQDTAARLLVYDSQNKAAANSMASLLPDLQQVQVEPENDPRGSLLPDVPPASGPLQERMNLSATHSILYTAGTTGRPKGAQLTYGNHWWSAMGSALNLGLHQDDRWLACLPLFHVGGLSILLRSVIYGIPTVIHSTFDPDDVNQALEDEGITLISVVSTMLQRMLEARGEQPYPTSLRCVLVGGGPVPGPLLETCARQKVPVLQTYGLTETASQVATLAPADALRKLGSAGQPLFPTEVRIQQDGTTAGVDQIGEIVVRGPTVTPGYWQEATTSGGVLRDGWLHTGDLGYMDDEGYLYVMERQVDLIISGGENVYPSEVEAVLLAHPDIADAGVVGVPDPDWGQVVAAAVVLRPGASLDPPALQAFCSQRIARYKVPAHIRVVTSLPRNPGGKLIRHTLPEHFAG